MISTIKFKCVTYNGKIRHFSKKYEHEDFEDEVINSLLGVTLGREITITKESKIMEWLDNQDKREFMDENDIHLILDYWIVSTKTKKQKSESIALFKKAKLDAMVGFWQDYKQKNPNSENIDKLITDFFVCYDKMKDSISELSITKQFEITFKGMDIAYKSAINVYDHMKEFEDTLKAMYNENAQKSIDHNASVRDFFPTPKEVNNRINQKSKKIENQ